MKKALLFAAATLASVTALGAGKIIVRSDYVNTPEYKDASSTEIGGTSLLLPIVSRIESESKLGEATIHAHLNLRSFIVDLDSTTGSLSTSKYNKVMTVDKFVERLFIERSMGDWTFAAGKLNLNVGGFERDLVTSGDTYLTSLANNGVAGKKAAAGSGNKGTVAMPENASGVSAAYKMGEHMLTAQMSNQTNTDATQARNREHTLGLQYDSSFMEKALVVRAGYTMGNADTATKIVDQTFMNVGVKYTGVENLSLAVEHLNNSSKASTAKADSSVSNVVEARYNMGMYTPVFKYEMSENKLLEEADFKRTGMALALEIVPKAEEAFRYHVAYTSVKDDFDASASKDVTYNQITIGAKYTGNLW